MSCFFDVSLSVLVLGAGHLRGSRMLSHSVFYWEYLNCLVGQAFILFPLAFEMLDSGKLVHWVRSAALVVLEPLVALLHHDGFSYLVEISNQRAVANSLLDA